MKIRHERIFSTAPLPRRVGNIQIVPTDDGVLDKATTALHDILLDFVRLNDRV